MKPYIFIRVITSNQLLQIATIFNLMNEYALKIKRVDIIKVKND